jgi:hypothetical protein
VWRRFIWCTFTDVSKEHTFYTSRPKSKPSQLEAEASHPPSCDCAEVSKSRIILLDEVGRKQSRRSVSTVPAHRA